MDSERLPGKALKPIGEVPLIEMVTARTTQVRGVDDVVLATTGRDVDLALVEYAKRSGMKVFCGAVEDVAGRMLACAEQYQADYIVRVNGDSPFVDAELVGEGVRLAKRTGADFVTNIVGRTFPYGISVEVLKTAALRSAYACMSREEKEHVTTYLYRNMADFVVEVIRNESTSFANGRFVVDTIADYEWMLKLYEAIGPSLYSLRYSDIPARLKSR